MKLARIWSRLRSHDWRAEWFYFRRSVAILFARSCRFERVGGVVEVWISGELRPVARRVDSLGWSIIRGDRMPPRDPDRRRAPLAVVEALELRYVAAQLQGWVR